MRQLGGYTLTHRLGAGGMGEVWRGRRSALGGSAVDVAIKVLSVSMNNDLDARGMFLDEARLSMLLTNSNIVKVFDAAENEDKTCFMVMEWVDGLNLSELTDKLRKAGERLPDSITAFIVGEVLKGLAHAHELRHEGKRLTIVHRDVSPHNVMLSVSGEVKVMDFGIARVASEDTSGLHVKGKLRYMPPEQLRGDSREPTLDLFAVGAILHECLDGTKFRSQVIDEGRLYGMVLDGEIPAMSRPPETVPKELDDLRLALLAAKPENRIQTAREAFRRLAAWPGYRDARFDLDEIVRRFTSEREPASASPPPRSPDATLLPGELSSQGLTQLPAALAQPPAAETSVTEALALEESDTDVSRFHASSVDVVVPASRPAAPPSTRRRDWVLAISGVSLLGFAIAAVVVVALGEKDRQPVPAEVAKKTDLPPATEETRVEEPKEDKKDVVEPPPKVDPPPPKVDPPLKIELPPKEEDPPPKVEPTKTKVTFALGTNVAWAEIKLGSRIIELDALESKKSATSWFLPGSYDAFYRTQVNGPWTSARRVRVSSKSVAITLQKGGQLVVK